MTVGDILNNNELDMLDDVTLRAAQKIAAAIASNLNKLSCRIPIVDVPVLWHIFRTISSLPDVY